MKFNSSTFSPLESKDEWTLMLKKFYWPLLYSPNPWEKIFSYNNFSTNQISRKNQIQLFDFFLVGIERRVNTDAEKILLAFVVLSKSVRKKFFFIKIFRPIRFRENMKFNLVTFCSLESTDEWTLMLKKFYWPLLYSQNQWEKIFFNKNFSTNQNSRKHEIQFIDFLLIGIDGRVNTDAEKILLTFVVFSKLVRKEFFFIKIFRPIRFRENMKFNLVTFCSLESTDEWTLMLKKFYWPLLYSQNQWEKIFFNKNFSTNQNSRKYEIQFIDFLLIGIDGRVNTDAEKILLTFVVFSKLVRKEFFFIKIFRPIRFREKLKFDSSTFSRLESTDKWPLMHKKFYWPLLYSQNQWEKIFFNKNFSTNQNSRKYEIQFIDFLLIGIDGRVNTDAEKILLTFVVFSKLVRKEFFFIKIFRPIRFREKLKFDSSTFSRLESTDKWPLMHKKFYWPLLYSRNRWEKKFSTNQISRKNQIQLFDFFLVGIERRVNIDAEKILLAFVVLSKSVRKKFFFLKIFRPIRLRQKIKFNQSIFCSLESTNEWTLMLRKLFSFSRDAFFPWRSDKNM